MGDSSDGDSACLFNTVMGDMKTMMPLWEDFLIRASKFYNAIKSTAYTADAFLESFQKLADATTSSKGSTRDIGVLFTKLVMRHKSIEYKLKTYIGILTDSFIGPLQEKIEEWKKSASQLEKDHSKDFKKAKSETKKAVAEVMKLKKKVVKKGRTEFSGQYKDAWKFANLNIAALEEQERQYLRKLMVEDRARAIFFFNCYRPVVEQELSMVGEVESLQSLLEETIKHCVNPSNLPLASEDAIKNYKAPERAVMPRTEVSSPPPSPTLESARQRAFTSIPKGNPALQRSNTISGPAGSGYSTLRKKGSGGPAPKPIGIPNPGKSPSRSISTTEVPFDDTRESLHSSSGNISNFSSMSSLSVASGDQLASDANQNNQVTATYGDDTREQVAYYTQHEAKATSTASNGIQNVSSTSQATRTSWSSLETSDSSGIGSYVSLNSQGRAQQGYDKVNGYHSDGQYEMTEGYTEYDYDEDINAQMANLNSGAVQMPSVLQQPQINTKESTMDKQEKNKMNKREEMQQFQRNTESTSSLRGTRGSGGPFRRSNSLTEGEGPAIADYRMTMPRRPSNTVFAKNPPSGAKPTAFQIFAGTQTPAQLRSRLSPTGSPVKAARPPAPPRKVSSPPNLAGCGKSSLHQSGTHPQTSVAMGTTPVSSYASSSAGYPAKYSAAVNVGNHLSGYAPPPPSDTHRHLQNIPQSPPAATQPHAPPQSFGNEYITRSTAMQNYPSQVNEYAVPSLQPKPKSPEPFPPPPPALQELEQQQPPYQQSQQPMTSQYQTMQQFHEQQQQQQRQPPSSQQQNHNQPLDQNQYSQNQYENSQYAQSHYPQNHYSLSNYAANQNQLLRQQQYQREQQPQNYQAQPQQHQQPQPYQSQKQYSPSKQYQQPQYSYQQQLQQQEQYAWPQQQSHDNHSISRQSHSNHMPHEHLSRANHSADDEMPDANPGSFLDQLQHKRTLVRSRTLSNASTGAGSFGN